MTVRIGIVGTNFGRAFWFDKHPQSTVVAACDLDRQLAQKYADEVGAKAVYTDYDELLDDRNVDAIAVFTPAPLHAEMAIRAMEAGKHVLSAVPAAFSLEDCQRLVDTVEKTGLNYMLAETSYYYPEIMTLRRWQQDEQRLGEIFYSEGMYVHDAPEWADIPTDPQTLEERHANWRWYMPPTYYITHSTSGIISVTGERLTAVAALGHKYENPPDNRYGNPFVNTVALFKTSGGHAARVCEFRRCAWGAWTTRFEFYGTEMTFRSAPEHEQDFGHDRIAFDEQVKRFHPEHQMHTLPIELVADAYHGHKGSHPYIVHEFISSIVQQRRPAVDVYEAVAYTAPGIYAQESALKGGEWVEIRDFGSAATPRPSPPHEEGTGRKRTQARGALTESDYGAARK